MYSVCGTSFLFGSQKKACGLNEEITANEYRAFVMPSSARGTLSLSLTESEILILTDFFLMKATLNLKHFNLILLFLSECVDLLPICYMKLLNSQKKKKKKKNENENQSFFFGPFYR